MKPKRVWEWIKDSPVRMIAFVFCAAVLLVALIALVLDWAPHWLASDQRATEVDASRTALLALLAGAIAVVGAIYTARTFSLNRQTHEHTRETDRQSHELDRQGQITERFTRAIDQLGSEKLDVRLGGIYALERLAHESREDHGPIVEILTAFVREHVPDREVSGRIIRVDPPTTDVQAALTVLGRRMHQYDGELRLDLYRVVLTKANLGGAHLEEADLERADLEGANLHAASLEAANLQSANLRAANLSKATMQRAHLRLASLEDANLHTANLQEAFGPEANLFGVIAPHANLEKALFTGADLRGAFLDGTSLREANLSSADLEGATLEGAHLGGANLSGAKVERVNLQGANLQGASLRGASLRGASLRGANLDTANLDGAHLDGTLYDRETIWPEGFKPSDRGAILRSVKNDDERG
jgi:uncharacterized protein YjbI with pentapeptide repeats